ncbi:MAG: hypothetical protein ACK4IK_05020 [Bacteroidia bacterium]
MNKISEINVITSNLAMKIFSLIFIFILFLNFTLAQSNLKEEQINITGDYNPIINEASKISSQPSINDSTKRKEVPNYNFITKLYPTQYTAEQIQAAKIKSEALPKLERAYAKIGGGNYSTGLGELFIGSLRSKQSFYSLHYKHLSSSATLKNLGYSGFSNNHLLINGKNYQDEYTLKGNIEYKRNVVHYYGYDAENIIKTRNDIRQRFNLIGLNGSIENPTNDSSQIHYLADLSYYNLSDYYKAQENNVSLNAYIGKYHLKEFFRLNIQADYFKNLSQADTLANIIVKANPQVLSRGNKWQLKAGLRIALESQTNQITKAHFYPDVDFNYNIIDHILVPFIGITGDLNRNSYKTISTINPFISDTAQLLNTDNPIKAYGGFRGSISKEISFNSYFAYSRINNMGLFVNTEDDSPFRPDNKFLLIYDTAEVYNVHGEIAWQQSEKLRLIARGDYFKYNMRNQQYAWHMPNLEISLSAQYNLRDKIITKADVFLIGERYAQKSYFPGLPIYTEPHAVKLPAIYDFNLGFEYRYSHRLSAFINFNNITSYRYQRWYQYPSQRINILGGLTYSF